MNELEDLIESKNIGGIAEYFEAKGYKEGFQTGAAAGAFWTFVIMMWLYLDNVMREVEAYQNLRGYWFLLPVVLGIGWWIVRAWKKARG